MYRCCDMESLIHINAASVYGSWDQSAPGLPASIRISGEFGVENFDSVATNSVGEMILHLTTIGESLREQYRIKLEVDNDEHALTKL